MAERELFLLNPHHKAFVEGKSKTLGSAERAHYTHTFYMGPPTFIALLLMIGVLATIIMQAWDERQTRQQLAQGGASIEATIVALSDQGNFLQPYHMSYSFQPASPTGEPTSVTVEQAISAEEYQRFEQGETIPVRYLPQNPQVAQFDSNQELSLWICVPYILLPVLVIYAVSWYRSLDQWRWLRRLEKEGQLLDGVVLSCRDGIPLPKDRVQIWVKYRFQTPNGQEIEDKGEGGMEQTDPRPEPGTPVKVLYVDDQTYRVM